MLSITEHMNLLFLLSIYHPTYGLLKLNVNVKPTFLIQVRECILGVEYSSTTKILKLLIEFRFLNEELYTYNANQKERVLVTISLQNAF